MTTRPPFHVALPVTDLGACRKFYVETFGCRVGRESDEWVDLDFFGHQVTLHRVAGPAEGEPTNRVDGESVPVRHFGVILPWDDWHALADRLQATGVELLIRPGIRFAGRVGEQATFFLRDPSGNALELKAFRDPSRLFAREPS